MNWAFLQVFQRESDYECGALSGELMTLSSEVPVSFHNCIIWKWLRTALSQHFLIRGQLKTSHWFLQPILLECAHMKHILNHLSSRVLAPLNFCQHILLFVEIERQLHVLNSTTNKEKKVLRCKAHKPFSKQLEGVPKLLFHCAHSMSRCAAEGRKCLLELGSTSSTSIYGVITMSAHCLAACQPTV